MPEEPQADGAMVGGVPPTVLAPSTTPSDQADFGSVRASPDQVEQPMDMDVPPPPPPGSPPPGQSSPPPPPDSPPPERSSTIRLPGPIRSPVQQTTVGVQLDR